MDDRATIERLAECESGSPGQFEDAAEACEKAKLWYNAARMWQAAADASTGHKRTARYEGRRDKCLERGHFENSLFQETQQFDGEEKPSKKWPLIACKMLPYRLETYGGFSPQAAADALQDLYTGRIKQITYHVAGSQNVRGYTITISKP